MPNLAQQLANPGFLASYRAREAGIRDESADELKQVAGVMSLAELLRKQGQEQQLRQVLAQSGGDPAKAIPLLIESGNIQGARTLADLLKDQRPQRTTVAPGSTVLEGDKPIYTAPAAPQRPMVVAPGATVLGANNAPVYTAPDRPVKDEGAWGEPYNMGGAMVQKNTVTGQVRQSVARPPQTNITNNPAPHFERTVDDSGNVSVHAFGRDGKLINSTQPGGKTPSFLSNENVRERQLATQLERVKAPHLEVLNAYQRYEGIRATGDNAQANQFLAQQMMKMATTGQRVIPKAELERILGSGELGNDWVGRAANMVSQMVSGVRTPTIDRRLNELADAMARSSADRIGQEIHNTRARTPPGVDPARVVGSKPTIYGRFIVTPTGKVHAFASSAEAQAKLQAAAQIVGE